MAAESVDESASPAGVGVPSTAVTGGGWAAPLRDRRFMVLLGAYGCIAAAIATLTAGMPYLVRHVMQADEARLALFFTVFVIASLGGLAAWTRVATRVGKERALTVSAILLAAACLPLAIQPSVTTLLMSAAAAGFAVGGLQLLPFALLTDHVRSELGSSGAYTGIWTAVEKAGLATGPLVVGLMLALAGFQAASGTPGVPAAAQPDAALTAIRLAVSAAPALLLVAALALRARGNPPPAWFARTQGRV